MGLVDIGLKWLMRCLFGVSVGFCGRVLIIIWQRRANPTRACIHFCVHFCTYGLVQAGGVAGMAVALLYFFQEKIVSVSSRWVCAV
jgi:NhaP-type Na+/H+ or K+/H+ antiporter